MLSTQVILEFRKRTGNWMGYAEPGNNMYVAEDDIWYRVPDDETDEAFRQKIDAYVKGDKTAFTSAYQQEDPYPLEGVAY